MSFGIEDPSKSEVIGRCGGDKKTYEHAELTKVEHGSGRVTLYHVLKC